MLLFLAILADFHFKKSKCVKRRIEWHQPDGRRGAQRCTTFFWVVFEKKYFYYLNMAIFVEVNYRGLTNPLT